jgi:hypothetical protein
MDRDSNAIFPHQDEAELCGYEIKVTDGGLSRFSAGGMKALWRSYSQSDDNQLVFCESAIDALSYAILFPNARARYASIAGAVSDLQKELIRAAIAHMPAGSEIVAAMDADVSPRKHVSAVREAFELAGRNDLRFRDHVPGGVNDWNEQLQQLSRRES